MSSDIGPLPQPSDSDVPAWDGAGEACASQDRLLKMLERLAEAGLHMAIAIERQVQVTEPPRPLAELSAAALAYARVSRAVRLAILLQNQLLQGRGDAAAAARQAQTQAHTQGDQAHKDRAVRIVHRVARDHCRQTPYAVSVLTRRARERLDDDDLYSLVASRPVGELVAMICRDLGLDPDWDALAREPWAQAEIASGAQGSPFLDDDDWDDGDDPDDDDDAPDVPQAHSLQASLAALARDPDILAAAHRDTG